MTDKLIFFVDDEPMFLNLMEYTFKCRNGYATQTFKTGKECIENMYKKPDLVVIDFFLNDGDLQITGTDLSRRIKEIDPATPVIFLSGNDDKSAIDEAIAAGAERYIIKDGYFIDSLTECISKILPVET
jgi:CheY-like chemotaxis protein